MQETGGPSEEALQEDVRLRLNRSESGTVVEGEEEKSGRGALEQARTVFDRGVEDLRLKIDIFKLSLPDGFKPAIDELRVTVAEIVRTAQEANAGRRLKSADRKLETRAHLTQVIDSIMDSLQQRDDLGAKHPLLPILSALSTRLHDSESNAIVQHRTAEEKMKFAYEQRAIQTQLREEFTVPRRMEKERKIKIREYFSELRDRS